MVEISFQSNIDQWAQSLPTQVQRQLPFATALALNDTASEMVEHSKGWIQKSFDRPVRYTQNSMTFRRASKSNLIATFHSKTGSALASKGVEAGKYLRRHVDGSSRGHTRFEKLLIHKGVMELNEFAMPGRSLRLTRAGNVPPGIYSQIIAQLHIANSRYDNESAAGRAKRVKRLGAKRSSAIFVPKVTTGPVANRLPRGIWRRVGRKLEPLFIFVTNQPDYDDAFDVYGRAEQLTINRFPILFARRFEFALRTMR